MDNLDKKVLLVDDDHELIDSMTDLLTLEGYTVMSANDGKVGLAIAEKERPNIIILDIMMTHNTEGIELCRTIKGKAELKNTPIIMLTGISREMRLPFTFETDMEWLPAEMIMEKPVSPATLLSSVNNIIKKNEATTK